MSEKIKISKGLNIRIKGTAEKILTPAVPVTHYAVKPVDFPGLVPRMEVKPGDEVKAGTVLFTDKFRPEIKFTSPVSGKVADVLRGDRRKLLEVVIEVSGNEYINFGKADPSVLDRDQIITRMLESGLWPVVRQRPYHVVARPDVMPKSIFISGFDTSPLAPDNDFIMHNSDKVEFHTGLKALAKLTNGKVNLVLDGSNVTGSVLRNTPGVEIHFISGPHPAGNVGVQIHHLDPVNKGETVWYVNLQDVSVIGRLFNQGIYRHDRIIALAGSEVLKPGYYRVRSGASIAGVTKGNTKGGDCVISAGMF
jgi:Na+-transporting NADH:ubiquinone oxidoreductase subunit A